jgi:hypothetical protein
MGITIRRPGSTKPDAVRMTSKTKFGKPSAIRQGRNPGDAYKTFVRGDQGETENPCGCYQKPISRITVRQLDSERLKSNLVGITLSFGSLCDPMNYR